MACDYESVQEAACESGIGKVENPIKLLQVAAQSLCSLTSPTAPCGNLDGVESPLNLITPEFIGQVYVQTGGIVWQAGSLLSSSWTVICEGSDLFLFDSGDTFTFSSTALTSLTDPLWIANCPFVTISLPNLVTSTNYIDIDNCPDLTSTNLDALESCGDGTDGLFFSDNDSTTSLSLPAFETSSGTFSIQNNTLLVTISVPSFLTCSAGNMDWDTNPALTTVVLSSFIPRNGMTIGIDGCALSQASVDLVLARCVANAAYVTGTVNLDGGTNSAPSAAGLVNVGILTGRGVTVNNN